MKRYTSLILLVVFLTGCNLRGGVNQSPLVYEASAEKAVTEEMVFSPPTQTTSATPFQPVFPTMAPQGQTLTPFQPDVTEVSVTATLAAPETSVPPTPDQPTQPDAEFTLCVVADFGDPGNPAQKVFDMLATQGCDALATAGDNNYPTGAMNDFGTHTDAHVLSVVPIEMYFPALGNHDWGYPWENSFKADNLPHSLRYTHLPGNRRYYDVTLGNGLVHLVVLDSDVREPDGRQKGSIQYKWVREVVQDSIATWQIVVMHETPFSSCRYDNEPDLQWPFQDWGANVVVSGHCHNYARIMQGTFPYFITGWGGGGGNYPCERGDVCIDGVYGALVIHISPNTMTFNAISVDGRIVDTHQLTR